MDLSIEALALAIIFLLPGYAAHRLTGYFSSTPQREISSFDSLLTSLGTTVGILLAQGAALTGVAALCYWLKREWLTDLALGTLVRSGFRAYLLEKPWETILFLGGVSILTAFLAYQWGLHDPVGKAIRARQLRMGRAPSDMWVMALKEDAELRKQHAYVSVRVRPSRDVFQGIVRGFSFQGEDDEPRDLYLQNVTYIPSNSNDDFNRVENDKLSGVVLNSSNIESLTIIYV